MRLLTANQKQQRFIVCEGLREIASDNAISLSGVIIGTEGWIHGYNPDTKQ
jgi:hypothetical protein